jgi:hypothetical protein
MTDLDAGRPPVEEDSSHLVLEHGKQSSGGLGVVGRAVDGGGELALEAFEVRHQILGVVEADHDAGRTEDLVGDARP